MNERKKTLFFICIFFLLAMVYFFPVLKPSVTKTDEGNKKYVQYIYENFEFNEDGYPVHEYPIVFDTTTKLTKQITPFIICINDTDYVIDFPMVGGTQSDYTTSTYHWEKLLANEIIENGQIPMWNQYQFCGIPTVTSASGCSLTHRPFLPLIFILQPFVILFGVIIYRQIKNKFRIVQWDFKIWWAVFWFWSIIINSIEHVLGILMLISFINRNIPHNIFIVNLKLYACGLSLPIIIVSFLMAYIAVWEEDDF